MATAAAAAVLTSLLSLADKRAPLREAAVSVVLELLLGGPGGGDAAAGPGAGAGADDRPPDQSGDMAANSGDHHQGSPAPSRWLSDAAVRQLLGPGPGGCAALRASLSVPADACTPEVRRLPACHAVLRRALLVR
jgi:hypothetical protein